MEWMQSHWVEILALVGAVDIALGVITKWTKADWDDNLYAQLHGLFVKFFPKR